MLLYARQTCHFAVSRTCCCMPVRHVILLFLGHAAVCPSDMSFCCFSDMLLYARQTCYFVEAVVSRTAAVSRTSHFAISRTGCCISDRLLYLGQAAVHPSDKSFCCISDSLLYLGQLLYLSKVILLYLGNVTAASRTCHFALFPKGCCISDKSFFFISDRLLSRTGHFCCVLDRLLCLPEVVVSRTGYFVVNQTCCCCCSSVASSAISRTGCRISDRLLCFGQPFTSPTQSGYHSALLCKKLVLFRLFLSQTALSWSCPVWTRRCRLIYKFRNTVSGDSVALANKGI